MNSEEHGWVQTSDLSYQAMRFFLRLAELRQSTVARAQAEGKGEEERARHRPMQGTNV